MTIEDKIENESSILPAWFSFITIVLFVWNLLGFLAFFRQQMMPTSALAQLPEAQQVFYTSIPFWAIAGFAVAVFGGVIGCVLLMFKKSLAYDFFIASFVGVLVQQFHAFVLANSIEVFGSSAVGMPFVVFVVALFLIWFSKHCIKQGWIA